MDPISLDQIRVFLAVVDHGSFSAAAKTLRRAQSAVSYAILHLEDQLGVKLFQRTNQRPVMTEPGRALLGEMRKVALDIDALKARAQGSRGASRPSSASSSMSCFRPCGSSNCSASSARPFPRCRCGSMSRRSAPSRSSSATASARSASPARCRTCRRGFR